jgi:uncharacterized protein YunC (DUF1805 family)
MCGYIAVDKKQAKIDINIFYVSVNKTRNKMINAEILIAGQYIEFQAPSK